MWNQGPARAFSARARGLRRAAALGAAALGAKSRADVSERNDAFSSWLSALKIAYNSLKLLITPYNSLKPFFKRGSEPPHVVYPSALKLPKTILKLF